MHYLGDQFVSKTNYGAKIKQIFYYQIQRIIFDIETLSKSYILNLLHFSN